MRFNIKMCVLLCFVILFNTGYGLDEDINMVECKPHE